jgi:stalled ribosome rescue protein Dom34
MSHHAHAVVWIDHRVAKIFEFNKKDVELEVIRHGDAAHQIHHKAGSVGSGHSAEDEDYLREVAKALSSAAEILILGPSHVKWQLRSYLNLHKPRISERIMAVVDEDHPSDGQIVDHARKYFSRIDRMTPQKLIQPR